MVVKKKVSKKGKKNSKASKPKVKNINSLSRKKDSALVNFVRVLIIFIVFLVLYFVTSNPILEILFGVGALITGALALAFILIFVGVLLYMRTHPKKR